jgi:tyrosyl-tRNA synthetase
MEVDNLKLGDRAWYLAQQEGHTVFACYQWKLVSVPREKRWKFIPVLFAEQERAIEIIRSGNFKRPLPKFIKKHLAKNANTYGGRKGFESLMRSKGRTFTEAQAWLGHASIETTWKSYRDQKKVFLEK